MGSGTTRGVSLKLSVLGLRWSVAGELEERRKNRLASREGDGPHLRD